MVMENHGNYSNKSSLDITSNFTCKTARCESSHPHLLIIPENLTTNKTRTSNYKIIKADY